MHIGVLLAGGASARMGVDKAGLVVDGVPLGARAVSLLRRCCARVVVVGHGRGVAPTHNADDSDVLHVPDEHPGAGPLVALRDALRLAAGLDADAQIVVIPVDMPALRADLLARLLAAPDDASCFAVARTDGAGVDVEPLPMMVRTAALARLEGLVRRGSRRLQDLAPTTLFLPAEEASAFANVNTPDDVRAFEARAQR